MTPALDLLLATLERALAVAVLPAAGNAAAREETGLAILFTRWIRGVVDDIVDAEETSAADCLATLARVTDPLAQAKLGPASSAAVRAARALLAEAVPGTAALRRERTHRAKALSTGLLRALRADGDAAHARELRAALYALGLREIERERAFGRATGLDPDSPTLPTLAELERRSR